MGLCVSLSLEIIKFKSLDGDSIGAFFIYGFMFEPQHECMPSNFFVWNPNPIFFTIPMINWPVRWYGLSWALAFFVSNIFMGRIFKAEKRTESQLDSLTFYIVIATVVGARLGHCFFYDPEKYFAHPLDILKVYEGGLASHGAAIGIMVGMWFYCRKFKENLWWIFDRMMVVAPIGAFFIRFGNLMNSEIYGKVTDVPWAIVFTQVDAQPRHPAQLYEAVFYLFLSIFMNVLWSKKRKVLGGGYLCGLLFVLMFSFRFFVEFIKENQSSFENQMFLNMGQILSIPFVIVGIMLMKTSVKRLPK